MPIDPHLPDWARLARALLLLPVLLVCSNCTISPPLPRGSAAYGVIPQVENPEPGPYRIGPLDTVSVIVLDEPQLSAASLVVDPNGSIALPTIGSIKVAGMTSEELGNEVTNRLRRYLRHPTVTVNVASSSQTIAIEGHVNKPGIYDIKGTSSLIEAMALAQSPTRIAALDEVIVFREINGRRAGAVFDLRRIRAGVDPDPPILGGDRIVVGFSALDSAWVDFLHATPLINVFRYF